MWVLLVVVVGHFGVVGGGVVCVVGYGVVVVVGDVVVLLVDVIGVVGVGCGVVPATLLCAGMDPKVKCHYQGRLTSS